MKQNFILSSILLSSLLFNTGCMEKIQPIIPTSIPSESIVEEVNETTSNSPTVENTTPIPPPTPYKTRQMKTVQGGMITIRENNISFDFPEYRGKIVLVQIFGKECKYCFEELPTVNKIQEAYRDKLSVIAIQGQPPMTQEKAFELIRQHDMNYPIIDQDEAKSILLFLRDIYDWRGILPYILLVKDGQIEQVFQGADKSFEEISEGINEIH
jgi:thiol-disulfide isomerase/thioredoxin